jgi:RecB family endonuclease NucS
MQRDSLELTFDLERDLQRALRQNIGQLERGLRITDGGKEQVTDAGRIDIQRRGRKWTASRHRVESRQGSTRGAYAVIGYIGARSGSGGTIRGILVAPDFYQRVIYAARATPNV